MKNRLFCILFSLLITPILAQQFELSEQAEISIITVGPGSNLVDSFGHSAIRIKDESKGVDLAYNYGMYDFEAPNFYANFAKGKLLYTLGRYRFDNFLTYYRGQNRTVKEQQLNLTAVEAQTYFNFLENNARPENRGYLYDFFYDNCATKLRDVSQTVLANQINFDYSFAEEKDLSLRDLIHKYSYTQPWGTFGIDLALGSEIDRTATPEEYVFLPDYIFESFDTAQISTANGSIPLVRKSNTLFEAEPRPSKIGITPLVVFILLASLILLKTFRDFKNKKRSKWLDFTLFFITGIVGLLMLLLWFATDHTATVKNYNVLWAVAPNLLMAFFLIKKTLRSWLIYYLYFLIGLLICLLVIAALKIQAFNLAIYPVLLALAVRYLYLAKLIKD